MNNEMIKVVTENRLGIGANKIATNDSELSSNRILKATTGGVTNSNITDDGTTVTIEKPIKATSGVSATNAAATTGKFTGDLIGNALTADTLKTSRTLKIGNTNKEFDGSANVAWTHNEIGVSRGGFVIYSYGGFDNKPSGVAWGWIRIASIESYGYATFSISKDYNYGPPAAVKFFVTSRYGTAPGTSIVQLGGKTNRFSKARIVHPPTGYGTGYVEVYYDYALHAASNNLSVSLSDSYLTTLLDSKTQGEIPEGWTVYERTFTDDGVSAKSGLFNNLVIDKGANNETGSLTIGSSSAPATLNMYGKSTLRDRLTVPKDGSNSTSGIIDAGDSYYLGGNRWIHNQGGNTCTAVGYIALYNNTEGSYNSAMGYAALYVNVTGSNNSAMGGAALRVNTKGSNNSAMGSFALRDNTEGSNNSAMGYAALYGNRTGSNNSAMGYEAGRYIANGSTIKTSGDNNLYLGSITKAKENGTNNEIVIGAYATGLGSNSMVLGHTTNLLTALRGKVGIGTDAPEYGLHVGTSYDSDNNIISDGNIKANNKLIAGTHVEAGGNITAVETVQGKNIAAVASNSTGGDINADNNINAGYNITAQNNVTGFVVNAIKDINAGNNITATETVTGKNLVATQSITAGTTIDAGGNITSDDTVQGNYVNAVKKNDYGGDVTAANNVFANNIVGAGNHVIAQEEVKAGQAINTSEFTSLNNGEYLMDCNHNELEIPLHLGNEAMICGIITNSRYDLTSEDILLELPLGTSGRLFQVETMLAFRIIVSDSSSNEFVLREETININSIISTLNDSNGYKIQKHKVMSDLCVGYNIAQNTVTAWESDYEYEYEQDSLLPSDFFTFEKTFLGAAKLKPKATLDEHKIEALLYETGFIGCDYNIEYSYKINTNILGTSSIMNWAKK